MIRDRAGAAGILVLATILPASSDAQIHDDKVYTYTVFDRLEYGLEDGSERVLWNAQMWVGGDYDKLWIKTEGEGLTTGGVGGGELQALWSRMISPFWDVQLGGRLDILRERDDTQVRGQLSIGLEGLAPYWFELEPTLFVSHQGDVSVRFAGSYDALVTQRLILQGRLEGELAAQSVPEFGVGSGLSASELGFRLRYEMERKFAPFVGWRWGRRYGETADLARDGGEEVAEGYLVVGVRAWF